MNMFNETVSDYTEIGTSILSYFLISYFCIFIIYVLCNVLLPKKRGDLRV